MIARAAVAFVVVMVGYVVVLVTVTAVARHPHWEAWPLLAGMWVCLAGVCCVGAQVWRSS